MRFKDLAVAAAVLSITATPALAAPANPAASLSVGKSVRASSQSGKANKLAGGTIIPVVLFAGILAGGIIIAVDDGKKSKSP